MKITLYFFTSLLMVACNQSNIEYDNSQENPLYQYVKNTYKSTLYIKSFQDSYYTTFDDLNNPIYWNVFHSKKIKGQYDTVIDNNIPCLLSEGILTKSIINDSLTSQITRVKISVAEKWKVFTLNDSLLKSASHSNTHESRIRNDINLNLGQIEIVKLDILRIDTVPSMYNNKLHKLIRTDITPYGILKKTNLLHSTSECLNNEKTTDTIMLTNKRISYSLNNREYIDR